MLYKKMMIALLFIAAPVLGTEQTAMDANGECGTAINQMKSNGCNEDEAKKLKGDGLAKMMDGLYTEAVRIFNECKRKATSCQRVPTPVIATPKRPSAAEQEAAKRACDKITTGAKISLCAPAQTEYTAEKYTEALRIQRCCFAERIKTWKKGCEDGSNANNVVSTGRGRTALSKTKQACVDKFNEFRANATGGGDCRIEQLGTDDRETANCLAQHRTYFDCAKYATPGHEGVKSGNCNACDFVRLPETSCH